MFRALQTTVAGASYVSTLTILLCSGSVGSAFGASDGIAVRGTLDADKVEIRCELPPQYASITTVVEVVPEGREVEVGDLLVRLDSIPLENELVEQQLKVIASDVERVEAQSELEVSEIALEVFLKGTCVEQKEAAMGAVTLAHAGLKLATQSLDLAKKLFAENKISAEELADREFRTEEASERLRAAKLRADVLEKYTETMTVKKLEGAIRSCKARLNLAHARYESHMKRLNNLKIAIDKCVIRSPAEGRVHYYPGAPGQPGEVIRPGHEVRARQVFLRLNNYRKIQFHATLSKGEAEQVREGLLATIRTDAFPNLSLKGQVQKVQATPGEKTLVLIEIADPPDSLRPGMTGEALITIAESNTSAPVEAPLGMRSLGTHLMVDQNGIIFYRGKPVGVWGVNGGEVEVRQ